MRRFLAFLPLALLLPFAAHAATLSVAPSSTSVNVGDLVTARILVNTQGTAINEGDGTLRFPSDLLQVVSVGKSSSLFTLWVEEPSYSNAAGTVSFDGGIPTPGFTGNGTVLTVTFKAKAPGTATLALASAAVRANDGLGTDVLTSSSAATLSIVQTSAPVQPSTPTPSPSQPSNTGANAISELTSSTHPDQSAWYSAPDALFSWKLPAGATAVELILGKTATTVPTVAYAPALEKKAVIDIGEGISYFNVRAKTVSGWGPVASYRLQIDLTPPTLTAPSFAYDSARHELVVSGISGSDGVSGVSSYGLTIDNGEPVRFDASAVTNGVYRMHYRSASAAETVHQAALFAYDRAGNEASTTGTFTVPVALLDQTLFTIAGLAVTLLGVLLVLTAITIASLIAAIAAWRQVLILRRQLRTRASRPRASRE